MNLSVNLDLGGILTGAIVAGVNAGVWFVVQNRLKKMFDKLEERGKKKQRRGQ